MSCLGLPAFWWTKQAFRPEVLGVRTRSIQWGEIKKIRKTKSYNGYAWVDSFQVHDAKTHGRISRFLVNVRGDIAFTQEIRGLSDLLGQINLYARAYKIPLVVLDIQANAARLAPLKGAEYWRRGTARAPEVTVAEF